MYEIEKIRQDLKNNLSQFRYNHSIRVAEEAKKLAHHYCLNKEKAYIAGLIHDIAKEFTSKDNETWIKKYQLSPKWLSPEFQEIIHAEIGAVVAKEWYGVDEEIFNAVRYHTIGHVPMGWLDKIILIADKIARKIENPQIQEQRKLAYQNLDQALIYCLINQKEILEQKGKKLHPDSLKLLESLLNKK